MQRITNYLHHNSLTLKESIIAFELLEIDAPASITLERVAKALNLFQDLLSNHEDKDLVMITGFLICHVAVSHYPFYHID